MRFKHQCRSLIRAVEYISIPLWCDSNLYLLHLYLRFHLHFNSTLVRFKLQGLSFTNSSSDEFQFHSGAIQTGSSAKYLRSGFRISIPLWCDSNTMREGVQTLQIFYFNSTLVRFKPINLLADVAVIGYFNSTLVRFKQTELRARWQTSNNFNSTLVRFKRDRRTNSRHHLFYFNSTLVRFKPSQSGRLSLLLPYFNSTLVRFKH